MNFEATGHGAAIPVTTTESVFHTANEGRSRKGSGPRMFLGCAVRSAERAGGRGSGQEATGTGLPRAVVVIVIAIVMMTPPVVVVIVVVPVDLRGGRGIGESGYRDRGDGGGRDRAGDGDAGNQPAARGTRGGEQRTTFLGTRAAGRGPWSSMERLVAVSGRLSGWQSAVNFRHPHSFRMLSPVRSAQIASPAAAGRFRGSRSHTWLFSLIVAAVRLPLRENRIRVIEQ